MGASKGVGLAAQQAQERQRWASCFPSRPLVAGKGRSKGPKPLTPVIDPVFPQRRGCEEWAVGPWVGNRPKAPHCFKTKVGNELLFEIVKAMFLGLCNLPQPPPQPTPHLAPGLLPPPHRAPPSSSHPTSDKTHIQSSAGKTQAHQQVRVWRSWP